MALIPRELIERILDMTCTEPTSGNLQNLCNLKRALQGSRPHLQWFSLANQFLEVRSDLKITIDTSKSPFLVDFAMWRNDDLSDSFPARNALANDDHFCRLLTLTRIKLVNFEHSLNCARMTEDELGSAIRKCRKGKELELVLHDVSTEQLPIWRPAAVQSQWISPLFKSFAYTKIVFISDRFPVEPLADFLTEQTLYGHLTHLEIPDVPEELSEVAAYFLSLPSSAELTLKNLNLSNIVRLLKLWKPKPEIARKFIYVKCSSFARRVYNLNAVLEAEDFISVNVMALNGLVSCFVTKFENCLPVQICPPMK
ncbi:hypothetical protein L596_019610 [Steinernema carpocapsae]|uniref:Uncharacterized protein n=1 Tax=Steinernema carpocapsae TaxID=34508 RepID=A0A4U5MR16_STECR|nr:hypothetical protein L596_019610 [Steinernema carpocapsae]